MAKSKSRSEPVDDIVIHLEMRSGGPEIVSVVFGGVKVQTDRVKPTVYKQNVLTGQRALKRAADQISDVGVDIGRKTSVPTYRVDPKNVDRVIRRFRGRSESGIFEDGAFKVIP